MTMAASDGSDSSSGSSTSDASSVANNNLLERKTEFQMQAQLDQHDAATERCDGLNWGFHWARTRRFDLNGAVPAAPRLDCFCHISPLGFCLAHTDIIVLGAGVVGTSIALHLA